MARDVSGKGSWKEELLALTFLAIFISGFVFIDWVDANWEDATTEAIWQSDQHAIIPHYPTHQKDTSYDVKGNWTSHVRSRANLKMWYNDTIAIYAGNNTWTTAMIPQTAYGGGGSGVLIPFEIPNANLFLINAVDYRVYDSILDQSNVFLISLQQFTLDGEIDTGNINPDNDIAHSTTLLQQASPSDNYYNGTASVGLDDAIMVNSISKNDNIMTTIFVLIIKNDGWPEHTVEVSLTINGTYLKSLSASNIIYIGLGVATVINVIATLFMTDRIDINMIFKRKK